MRYERTFIDVPVELPQSVGLKVYVGGGSPRSGEAPGGILDLGPAAWRYFLVLFGEAIDVRVRNIAIRRNFSLFVGVALLRRGDGAPKNVGVHCGKTLEIGDAEAEVLGDNFARGVNEPVGKHERSSGGVKGTVGEHQQELETVIQCLDTMCDALGEPRGAICH